MGLPGLLGFLCFCLEGHGGNAAGCASASLALCSLPPHPRPPAALLPAPPAAAARPELPRVVSLQNAYSLLCRTFDAGLAECCHQERVSLLAYSPLAMGGFASTVHGHGLRGLMVACRGEKERVSCCLPIRHWHGRACWVVGAGAEDSGWRWWRIVGTPGSCRQLQPGLARPLFLPLPPFYRPAVWQVLSTGWWPPRGPSQPLPRAVRRSRVPVRTKAQCPRSG